MQQQVEHLLQYALDVVSASKGQGVTYADVRYRKTFDERILTLNNVLNHFSSLEEEGIAIRVLKKGRWGFAATSKLSQESVASAAASALAIAEEAAKVQSTNIVLSEDKIPSSLKFKTEIAIDPFSVPTEEKINLLFNIYEEVKGAKAFKRLDGVLRLKKFQQLFKTLDGASLENEIYLNEITYTVTVVEGKDFQSRTFYGIPKSAGYEWVLAQNPLAHARKIAEEALQKLRAAKAPAGRKDLILLPSNLYLTIHESVGHPTELDRVLGWEANFAGTSFATTEKRGKFRYASPLVNFRADNTLPGGLATLGHDDDGIPSKSWDIIKEGILVNYGSTRDTAPFIGERESMGCNRADSYASMPINRIPNLSLMPGRERLSLVELIADTKDGILIDGRGSFSIDQQRLNFQFGGDFFQEIKNGKIVGPLRDVTYQSITPEFWQSCDAICDEREWQLFGTLNCGKGEPSQVQHMTHASSPARFRNVLVGGAF
ncbi:MAG: TldD/PmbA family protein [Oligoflexia bacterium]|nr:TldD/PmbA family protein [Oligoflexia bacterium]MBF0366917.1 TldD/PmbA family protein [Oligoflexia bacterium]